MHPRPLLAAALLWLNTALFAQDPAHFEVGALKFERPSAWAWVPVNSPMRKAQLKVSGKNTDQSAEITFFHFGPGMGGGVDANAKRWISQFESKENVANIEPQNLGSAKVTLVTTEGIFRSGMPGGPTTALNDYALLGAIVENPEGDVFIKMTGPASLVKSQRTAFLDFIAGAVPVRK